MRLSKNSLGFTVTELLVALVIVAVFASITFTIAAPAKEKSRQMGCIANLKQLYLATQMYTSDWGDDNGGWYPGATLNASALVPLSDYDANPQSRYGLVRDQLFCPDAPNWMRGPYASSYEFRFSRLTSSNPDHAQALEMIRLQANAEYQRWGESYPMIVCSAHDAIFYNPKNGGAHPALYAPFLIVLHLDGSVTSRHEPDMRASRAMFDPSNIPKK